MARVVKLQTLWTTTVVCMLLICILFQGIAMGLPGWVKVECPQNTYHLGVFHICRDDTSPQFASPMFNGSCGELTITPSTFSVLPGWYNGFIVTTFSAFLCSCLVTSVLSCYTCATSLIYSNVALAFGLAILTGDSFLLVAICILSGGAKFADILMPVDPSCTPANATVVYDVSFYVNSVAMVILGVTGIICISISGVERDVDPVDVPIEKKDPVPKNNYQNANGTSKKHNSIVNALYNHKSFKDFNSYFDQYFDRQEQLTNKYEETNGIGVINHNDIRMEDCCPTCRQTTPSFNHM